MVRAKGFHVTVHLGTIKLVVLGMESRTFCKPSKNSATELRPFPNFCQFALKSSCTQVLTIPIWMAEKRNWQKATEMTTHYDHGDVLESGSEFPRISAAVTRP